MPEESEEISVPLVNEKWVEYLFDVRQKGDGVLAKAYKDT